MDTVLSKVKCVLLFGDSLTAGSYFPEGAPDQHWVSILSERWGAGVRFLNEGKGGRPSDSLPDFAAALSRHPAPDLLVLWLGTNDSREMDGEVAIRTARNLEGMIRLARERYGSGLSILLVAPPNIHPPAYTKFTPEFAAARQANLRAIGGAIRELSLAERCAFLDLFGVLSGESLARDGVHPDGAGNLAMAGRLAPEIAHILNLEPV
jgi:acyl-CoA thioesterase I